MNQYRGASGRTYNIDPEPIAKGGEGTIHAVEGADDIVAKVYKKEKRTVRRYEKLSLMVQYQLTELQRKQVTWPLDVIYEGNEFAGYIMPRLYSTQDFTMVCGADITSVNLEDRLFIAYNICAAVDTVHSFGQVCGDLNPQNICVNLDASDSETGLMVTLVDTDSYHIVNGRMMYRCEVGQSNYLPPELQNRLYQGESLSTMALPTYSRETDRFALAVHLFSLFMNGCHPFACAIDMSAMDDFDDSVEVPQPSENIREGFIPFIHHKPGITYPAYAPEFTSLPDSFQKLFIRTFVDGHTNPSVRVSAREWMQAIMEVLQNKSYIKCPQGHIYFIHKMECPYCDMSRRNQHLREQVAPPPIIEEPEEETQQPPAQIPLEHSPAGWQSASSEKQSRPAAREPKEAKEFNFGTFIEEHIIHIVYGCIILFIVLFVAWYMGS